MKKSRLKFGAWGRSAWTGYLELTATMLAGLLALEIVERCL
jgi:hypothetical protein